MKLYQFGIINGTTYTCTAINEKVANIKTTIKVGNSNVDLYGTISTDLWEDCVTEYLTLKKQQQEHHDE
jgi:hypothetical protein